MHGSVTHENELWEKWVNDGNSDAVNELVQVYDYLVSFHVQRISAHLPKSVCKDDVRSLGLLGLYDALRKFDVNRDLKFDTYASFRIRGSIIDGLRKEDWLPRSVRDKSKKVEAAAEELEQHYKRPPTSGEVAEKTSMSKREVEEVMKDTLFANVLSMEEKPKEGKEEHKEGIGYSIPDQGALSPTERIIQKENYQELAEQIKNLNEKEQLVVSLFYTKELTLTEIGEIMELTTSRISQIHARALFKLRHSLIEIVS
ncbi:FliA/WhiG family RNA polymerase sigma factor [Halobacillus sp. Marseille-P3879]|uniref:FliA/WhiG family RNA polymerase sigma factor n=1 Tax=Halobacillus TaxID=45667 RepID=UPI000C7A885E|nr:FliA/WhiG family RNA polymerase sigma factor [Halobacillus sp. Marseille-P3879]